MDADVDQCGIGEQYEFGHSGGTPTARRVGQCSYQRPRTGSARVDTGNRSTKSYSAAPKYGWRILDQFSYSLRNLTADRADRFLQAVIPVNMNVQIPVPNYPLGGYTVTMRIQPADPLVNKFPGDWIPTTITSLDSWAATNNTSYASYDEYTSGFHSAITAAGGDADSFWMPQLDCAQSDAPTLLSQTLIPRSARFPSIGYLQYLRTGIIPDDESNVSDLLHQHGTPFRLLSFAPLTDPLDPNAQKTTLGSSQAYPDWALLDLLYVPSILYPFGGPYGYYNNVSNAWQGYGSRAVLADYSTGGGSTPGRINPNGMVIYTTNATTPTPNISRTLPMQAVLYGLKVNQSLVQQSYTQASTTPNPGFTGGTSVDYSGIAQAIYNYMSTNGPLRMPGELCDVPEIAALRPTVNHTRNDLMRQIIGNLTTQSNTFSVWVAGQSLLKSKGNTIGPGLDRSELGIVPVRGSDSRQRSLPFRC